MLDAVILYSLAVYLVFHVLGRSDLLVMPRAWVLRALPGWMTYPLSCALCFAWWFTLAGNVLGLIQADLIVLFTAPVVNLVLDLIIKALIRVNEPPVIELKKLTQEQIVHLPFSGADYAALARDITFNPIAHEQTK